MQIVQAPFVSLTIVNTPFLIAHIILVASPHMQDPRETKFWLLAIAILLLTLCGLLMAAFKKYLTQAHIPYLKYFVCMYQVVIANETCLVTAEQSPYNFSFLLIILVCCTNLNSLKFSLATFCSIQIYLGFRHPKYGSVYEQYIEQILILGSVFSLYLTVKYYNHSPEHKDNTTTNSRRKSDLKSYFHMYENIFLSNTQNQIILDYQVDQITKNHNFQRAFPRFTVKDLYDLTYKDHQKNVKRVQKSFSVYIEMNQSVYSNHQQSVARFDDCQHNIKNLLEKLSDSENCKDTEVDIKKLYWNDRVFDLNIRRTISQGSKYFLLSFTTEKLFSSRNDQSYNFLNKDVRQVSMHDLQLLQNVTLFAKQQIKAFLNIDSKQYLHNVKHSLDVINSLIREQIVKDLSIFDLNEEIETFDLVRKIRKVITQCRFFFNQSEISFKIDQSIGQVTLNKQLLQNILTNLFIKIMNQTKQKVTMKLSVMLTGETSYELKLQVLNYPTDFDIGCTQQLVGQLIPKYYGCFESTHQGSETTFTIPFRNISLEQSENLQESSFFEHDLMKVQQFAHSRQICFKTFENRQSSNMIPLKLSTDGQDDKLSSPIGSAKDSSMIIGSGYTPIKQNFTTAIIIDSNFFTSSQLYYILKKCNVQAKVTSSIEASMKLVKTHQNFLTIFVSQDIIDKKMIEEIQQCQSHQLTIVVLTDQLNQNHEYPEYVSLQRPYNIDKVRKILKNS